MVSGGSRWNRRESVAVGRCRERQRAGPALQHFGFVVGGVGAGGQSTQAGRQDREAVAGEPTPGTARDEQCRERKQTQPSHATRSIGSAGPIHVQPLSSCRLPWWGGRWHWNWVTATLER